jgi:pyruvate dehydrogenase (quinone)
VSLSDRNHAEIAWGEAVATVADHVISALSISGIRRVYGLPGDILNGFTDAIRRSPEPTP